MNNRSLFIPVILGTVRKGRASENIARFVFDQVGRREGVETELVDIRELNFPPHDAGDIDYSNEDGPVQEIHTCPECGRSESRQAE